MPVREKDPRRAGSPLERPLPRPLPAQTAAEARGSSPAAPQCTTETDSALEGIGFEPSVPRRAPYDTLKALREGVPPRELKNIAPPELMRRVTRADDYQQWTRDFLGGA
jgi:hypothetical protein